MPPEWAPHLGTWLTWPWEGGDSFPNKGPQVFETYRQLVAQLASVESVFINVWNDEMEAEARHYLQLSDELSKNVSYHKHPAYEPWCRDHGPVFLTREAAPKKAIVDWGYNAWGGKYPPFDLDNAVPRHIAKLRKIDRFDPDMILEGGSIEVNGAGLLITTESCLLNPNRNPDLSKQEIESRLRSHLGVEEILWLGDGIVGDDTDGHIDDMTRFVNETTIVTAIEANQDDANFQPLQENRQRLDAFNSRQKNRYRIVDLPMPNPVVQEGLRLPASYANFYIANQIVIVPTFNDPNDNLALEILQTLMPQRRIIGIDSTTLIWGLGSFHCITQQEPIE